MAPRLVEDVVDFQPRRLHFLLPRSRGGLAGSRVAGQGDVELPLSDAGRQSLGEAAEPGLDDLKPLLQVVGARVELGVGLRGVGQPLQVGRQRLDAVPVLRLRLGDEPAFVVDEKLAFRFDDVGVFRRLALGA